MPNSGTLKLSAEDIALDALTTQILPNALKQVLSVKKMEAPG